MCPICWISGFVAAIFGGSLLAVVNHPISWILSGLLIAYAAFKFYEAKQKGNKMTKETKARNRRTIFRFVQGVVLGVEGMPIAIDELVFFYRTAQKE